VPPHFLFLKGNEQGERKETVEIRQGRRIVLSGNRGGTHPYSEGEQEQRFEPRLWEEKVPLIKERRGEDLRNYSITLEIGSLGNFQLPDSLAGTGPPGLDKSAALYGKRSRRTFVEQISQREEKSLGAKDTAGHANPGKLDTFRGGVQ